MPSKEEIEKAINHFIEHHDVESAIVITKSLLTGYIVIEGGRRNITRDAMSVILADYEQLEAEKEKIKEDSYWEGYIQKQNEAMQICKMCKYRKKVMEGK